MKRPDAPNLFSYGLPEGTKRQREAGVMWLKKSGYEITEEGIRYAVQNENIKGLYVIPDYQNPTSHIMSPTNFMTGKSFEICARGAGVEVYGAEGLRRLRALLIQ